MARSSKPFPIKRFLLTGFLLCAAALSVTGQAVVKPEDAAANDGNERLILRTLISICDPEVSGKASAPFSSMKAVHFAAGQERRVRG